MSSLVPSESMRRSLESAQKHYAAQRPGSPGEKWLSERGITLETQAFFGLGFVAQPRPGDEMHANRVVIPYWTRSGVVALRSTSIPLENGSRPEPKMLPWYLGDQTRPFNTPALDNVEPQIYITEGECLPGHAEAFVVGEGWVRLDELTAKPDGRQVLQFEAGELTPTSIISVTRKAYDGPMVRVKSPVVDILMTQDHRLPYISQSGGFNWSTAAFGIPDKAQLITAGVHDGPGIKDMNDDDLTALMMNAKWCSLDDRLLYESSYPQKLKMLRTAAIATRPRRTKFVLDIFKNKGDLKIRFKQKARAEWFYTLASLAGFATTMTHDKDKGYYNLSLALRMGRRMEHSRWSKEDNPDEMVYCIEVPSSAFLMRQNGHISVTGNCDTMIAHQLGLKAVGIPGVKNWKPVYRNLFKYRQVTMIADSDDAGQGMDMAKDIVKQLSGGKILPMPDGQDLNSYYTEFGHEKTLDLILGANRNENG